MCLFLKAISFLFLLFFSNQLLSVDTDNNRANVEVGFSPKGMAKEMILHAIKNANVSIDIAAYSFTSKPISIALMEAQKRGVKVRLLADKQSNSNKYTAVHYLSNHHISVKLNDRYTIMHNKFMIIDDQLVQTGSFNYTSSAASRNAENIVFINHLPNVIKLYKNEFNRLWAESQILDKKY